MGLLHRCRKSARLARQVDVISAKLNEALVNRASFLLCHGFIALHIASLLLPALSCEN